MMTEQELIDEFLGYLPEQKKGAVYYANVIRDDLYLQYFIGIGQKERFY